MIWIDIEDASGVKVGDGPMQCLSWEHTPRLSRAGSWRAEVPLGESKLQYATSKMRVRCWQATPFGVIDIGSGIIDSHLTRISAGGSTVEIGGPDLMGELSYRLLNNVQLAKVETYVPIVKAVVGELLTWFTWDGDDSGTAPEILVEATDNYIYIGLLETTFNRIDIAMAFANVVVTSANIGVSDERGNDLYREPDDVEDTTINAGAPLGQNGYIRFTRPASWFLREIDGVTAYWVRLDPEKNIGRDGDPPSDGIKFSTVSVSSYLPRTDDDIEYLMTFAPDGWTLSPAYAQATEHGTMRVFDGDSLLNVLVNLSEERGEHFRLGNGREIEWLRQGFADSGIIALQAVGEWGAGTEGNVFEYGEFEELVPTPPATPTGFMAQPTGTNNLHVGLSWDDMGADGYIVEYDDGGGWVEIADTASTSYTHTAPTYGIVDHDYRVRGYTSDGESSNATLTFAGLLLNATALWGMNATSGNESDLIGSSTAIDNNTVGTTTGILGNARDFVKANSEYFSIANNSAIECLATDDWAILGWVKFDDLTGFPFPFSKRTGGSFNNGEWAVYCNGTALVLEMATTSGTQTVSSSVTLSTGTWYFVALLHDASGTIKIRVNSTLDNNAYGGSISTNTAPLTLGQRGDGFYLDGALDQTWFYNKRMPSDDELDRAFMAGAGLAYPFN